MWTTLNLDEDEVLDDSMYGQQFIETIRNSLWIKPSIIGLHSCIVLTSVVLIYLQYVQTV